MKILITILLALFISSHAYAHESVTEHTEHKEGDPYFNTLEDLCEDYSSSVRIAGDVRRKAFRERANLKYKQNKDEDILNQIEKLTKKIDRVFKSETEFAKLYHYMDCSDFR